MRLRVYGAFPGVAGATGYDLLPSTANADGFAIYAYGQSILSRSWVLDSLHLFYRAPLGQLPPGSWNEPVQLTIDLKDGLPPMWVVAAPQYPLQLDRPVLRGWKGDILLTPQTAIVQPVTADPSGELPWWALDFIELDAATGAPLAPTSAMKVC